MANPALHRDKLTGALVFRPIWPQSNCIHKTVLPVQTETPTRAELMRFLRKIMIFLDKKAQLQKSPYPDEAHAFAARHGRELGQGS